MINTKHEHTLQLAQSYTVPAKQFYSVEFPGVVLNPDKAIEALGNLENINHARTSQTPLELYFRRQSRYSHPIQGVFVESHNLLLKTTKKRNKKNGKIIISHEIIGRIEHTCRYRYMADYQYNPNRNETIPKLREAIDQFDLDAMKNFNPAIEPELSENASIGAIPPPVFSRLEVPQEYIFNDNPYMRKVTVMNEQGVESTQLVTHYKTMQGMAITVRFLDFDNSIPTEPTPEAKEMHKNRSRRKALFDSAYENVSRLFNERPVWSRKALINQLNEDEARLISRNSLILYLTSYAFADGPWRDMQVRFGYDPRKDSKARIYQQISFRIDKTKEQLRINIERGDVLIQIPQTGTSHIFDGVHIDLDIVLFQLVDITQPLLAEMIKFNEDDRKEPDERDGWFPEYQLVTIRTYLRRSYLALAEGKKLSMQLKTGDSDEIEEGVEDVGEDIDSAIPTEDTRNKVITKQARRILEYAKMSAEVADDRANQG